MGDDPDFGLYIGLILVFILGISAGVWAGKQTLRVAAIKAGVGAWDVSVGGNTTFRFVTDDPHKEE